MTIDDLLVQRKKLIDDARALVERAEKEDRDLSADEREQYDKLLAKAQEIQARVERIQKLKELERDQMMAYAPTPGAAKGDTVKAPPEMEAYRQFLMYGKVVAPQGALRADVDPEGGYLIPEAEADRLLQAVDDQVFIRQFATIDRITTSDSLGYPSLDADPDDADWTDELNTGNEDSSMAFGKRTLTAHPLAKRIRISNKLLRLAPKVEAKVRERLSYKFGITMEKAYLLGDGAQKPLGVFVASNDGIPAGRDVTSATVGTITGDDFINTKYQLKAQYHDRGVWILHRNVMSELVKLKDNNGQYIFREGLRSGEPDTLLGRPVYMSEYAPGTITSGAYVAIFGDFSMYNILDSLAIRIQRLNELYAETNQTGFIGRYEGDGMPVLAEAFARLKVQ